MADNDKDQEEGGEEPIKVPKKSKLPLIIGAVAVVAGGAGAYMFLKPGHKEAAATEEHGEKEKPKKAAASHGGGHGGEGESEGASIVAMAPFVVNLADEDQVSYLKCTIALDLADKDLAASLEKRSPPIRNAVILYLSSLTLAETRGIQNKQKIISELTTRIGEILGKDSVLKVYLNEFVIQ